MTKRWPLTSVMANSGPRYSFPDCVDKHSTGGVGDKVTHGAAARRRMRRAGRLSGRGLGITGARSTSSSPFPAGPGPQRGALPGPGGADRPRRRRGRQPGPGGQGHLRPPRHHTGTVDSLALIGSSIVSGRRPRRARTSPVATSRPARCLHEDPGGGSRARRAARPAQRLAGHQGLRPGDRHGRRPGFWRSATPSRFASRSPSSAGSRSPPTSPRSPRMSRCGCSSSTASATLLARCAGRLIPVRGTRSLPSSWLPKAEMSTRWWTCRCRARCAWSVLPPVVSSRPSTPSASLRAPSARSRPADQGGHPRSRRRGRAVGPRRGRGQRRRPVARLYGTRSVDRATALVLGALTIGPDPVTPTPHVPRIGCDCGADHDELLALARAAAGPPTRHTASSPWGGRAGR